MELIEGEDLAARLRRGGRLAAGDVARIGLDVARALGVAHVRGIVHRDVKPGNILLVARRPGDGHRLRDRPPRRRRRRSRPGHDARIGPLLQSRAGQGRDDDTGVRHVQPRAGPVRGADRPAGVERRHHGPAGGRPDRRPGAVAARRPPGRAGRPRRDRRSRPRPRSGAPLSQRQRDGRRARVVRPAPRSRQPDRRDRQRDAPCGGRRGRRGWRVGRRPPPGRSRPPLHPPGAASGPVRPGRPARLAGHRRSARRAARRRRRRRRVRCFVAALPGGDTGGLARRHDDAEPDPHAGRDRATDTDRAAQPASRPHAPPPPRRPRPGSPPGRPATPATCATRSSGSRAVSARGATSRRGSRRRSGSRSATAGRPCSPSTTSSSSGGTTGVLTFASGLTAVYPSGGDASAGARVGPRPRRGVRHDRRRGRQEAIGRTRRQASGDDRRPVADQPGTAGPLRHVRRRPTTSSPTGPRGSSSSTAEDGPLVIAIEPADGTNLETFLPAAISVIDSLRFR